MLILRLLFENQPAALAFFVESDLVNEERRALLMFDLVSAHPLCV